MTRDTTGKSTLNTDAQGNTVAFPTVEEDSGGVYKSWLGFMTRCVRTWKDLDRLG